MLWTMKSRRRGADDKILKKSILWGGKASFSFSLSEPSGGRESGGLVKGEEIVGF